DARRIVLRLTPGRAFGTGEHPTTRMCLELLERHAAPGAGVLDAGTGSGILALAAWLQGCRPVTALDFDPEAIEVAARNARLNGWSAAAGRGLHRVAAAMDALAVKRYPIVLANLTAVTLERLMPDLAARCGRTAILSGILRGEEGSIAGAAAAHGL